MTNILNILGYYAISLPFFGLIGNSIIFMACLRDKQNSMFVLLCFLSVSDFLSLIFWNVKHFAYSTFQYDIQSINVYSCKIGNWIQFSSLQSSAWILVSLKKDCLKSHFYYFFFFKIKTKVLMSLDRLLIFKINKWRTIYFTRRIATFTCLFLTLFIYLLNSNVIFTYGFELITNNTRMIHCYTIKNFTSTYWMNDWNSVIFN
jgi:hypothetical protein